MKTILIAEDDTGMQDAIQLILTRAKFRPVVITNGDVLLRREFEVPDLFILDKQLSGVDGLDVCRFLKSQDDVRHIPVIMLSANPHIGVLSRDAGAESFLEKPFKMKELLELIGRYIDK